MDNIGTLEYFTERGRDAFVRGFIHGMTKPRRVSVSQWADENRILTPKYSSEPGPWKTDRVPYAREIMDCFSDPTIRHITVMAGTQLGKTEIELNCIACVIDTDPGPIMSLYPTDKATERFSKRFDDMVSACPKICEKVSASKSRDSANTKHEKDFTGGSISFVGAQSATDLASLPIRYLIRDEIDHYPLSAGKEGSPTDLSEARTSNFPDAKIFDVSSPVLSDSSVIRAEYESGDQRRFYVPCPKCGRLMLLEWKCVKWDRDENGTPIPESAYIECQNEECAHHWSESERVVAVKSGEWFPTKECTGHASFWINSLYSLFVPLSTHVKKFVKADNHFKKTGSTQKLQVFINTILAETWEDKGERMDDINLPARREDYGDVLPENVVVALCSVDVQIDRLEAQIVGWDEHRRGYGMGRVVLRGDTSGQLVWNALDDFLMQPVPHALAGTIPIFATAIDTSNFSAQIADFILARAGRRIYGIKGAAGADKDIWAKTPTKMHGSDLKIYIIGVDSARNEYYGRLRLPADAAGSIHINYNYSEKDCDEMIAEEVVTKYVKGRAKREWRKKTGVERNELFDLWTYNVALFYRLLRDGMNLTANARQMRIKYAGEQYNDTPPTAQAVSTKPTNFYGTVSRHR